jgi:3-hydroxyisobutyrate dehydrogenase
MTDLNRTQRIGWIGTGRMGFALAARLIDAGLDVAVWNRTRSKAEPLAELGATIVAAPADLADRDVVFTMVSTSSDLEVVVEQLLADTTKSPGVVVDCSTVSTAMSAQVRARLTERGIRFLASPVSGNGKVVKAGLLSRAAA